MKKFKSVDELVNQLKPSNPVYCIRRHTLEKASKFFQKNFKGKVLYAVKTNPNEKIIKQIIANGILDFDVASLNEIKLHVFFKYFICFKNTDFEICFLEKFSIPL